MRYIVDGSNLLGALGLALESDQAKSELVRLLASFSRAAKSKVDCVFDGARPDGFATSFGSLAVRFSHPRSGDDVIEKLASSGVAPCVVVTNDRALGSRLKSRRVQIESCADFRRRIESAPTHSESARGDGTDWELYFSDPKNRNV